MRILVLGLLACTAACDLPGRTDLVGRRARARLSANELHNLGLDALKDGQYGECASIMAQVLKRKRLSPAYGNLALCEAALGRHDAAAAALRQHPSPNSAAVRQARGLLAVVRGETDAARSELGPDGSKVLRTAMAEGEVSAQAWADAAFGAVPTPRQAPRGIMGN